MMYIVPFNPNLWIALPLTFIVVLKVFKVYSNGTIRTSFSFFLFFYSSLVNNCTNIPATLSRSSILRLIWIPWILMCIIVNNCYVSILVSHINVPHGGQPITNITQVLCTKNDGLEVFEGFAAPFEITNETSVFNDLIQINEASENQIIASRSQWMETKQNYNKAINFWKPSYQYASLFATWYMQDNMKQVVLQYIRSGGKSYLEKLKSYQNDDSCFSLLSPPLNPGLDTFSPSPHGYELLEVVLAALTDSEFDHEKYLGKFVQPKQRHYPKFSQILDKPVAKFTEDIYFGFVDAVASVLLKKYQPFVKEAAIEDELTSCEKSVYVSTTESMKDELDYLRTNYPTLNFYTLQHSLFKTITGWRFPSIQMVRSKLPKRIEAYHGESGIYQHLTRQIRMSSLIHRRNYTLIINKAKKVSAIKLSKPLQAFLIIILVGLLSTIVTFGFEIFITPNVPLYVLKFQNFFSINIRILRRSFLGNNNFHGTDTLG